MEKADHLGAVVGQGIHETPLKGGHSDLLTFPYSGDVIMEAKTHEETSLDCESKKQKHQPGKLKKRNVKLR